MPLLPVKVGAAFISIPVSPIGTAVGDVFAESPLNGQPTGIPLSVPDEGDGPTPSVSWALDSIDIPIALNYSWTPGGTAPANARLRIVGKIGPQSVIAQSFLLPFLPIAAGVQSASDALSQQFFQPTLLGPGQKLTFQYQVSFDQPKPPGATALIFLSATGDNTPLPGFVSYRLFNR